MTTSAFARAGRLIRTHGFTVDAGTSRRQTATLALPDGTTARITRDHVKSRVTSTTITGRGRVSLDDLAGRLATLKETP